jgi:ClpP class serine protease
MLIPNLLTMVNGMLMMEPRFVESLAAKITAVGKNDISLESIKAMFGFGDEEDKPQKTGSTAVITVRGAMTNRSWWRTSYQTLSAQLDEAMNDSSVERIVFDMDSPGGEVGGVFDLADKIYAARQKKPMSAVVSENACSACYLLAAAAGDKKMKVLPGTFSEEETQPQEAKQEQSNEEQANANSD